jgi:hypothetical protein
MKIKSLKKLNKVSKSEDLFGINLPPEFQCPRIDY